MLSVLEETTALIGEKERQILQYSADGFANKDIAVKMNLAVRTIESYKYRMMQKTGAKNILQLILALYKKGIIQ